MTPAEFDQFRARSLTALHGLYSAIHGTQDGEVPGDLTAYLLAVKKAQRDLSDALAWSEIFSEGGE